MNHQQSTSQCATSLSCASDCACRIGTMLALLSPSEAATMADNEAARAHELRCLKMVLRDQAWNTVTIGATALGAVFAVCSTLVALVPH